jgi:hypothetical protein
LIERCVWHQVEFKTLARQAALTSHWNVALWGDRLRRGSLVCSICLRDKTKVLNNAVAKAMAFRQCTMLSTLGSKHKTKIQAV